MPKRTMLALTLLCLILWVGLGRHGAVQVAAQATSGAPTSYSVITPQNANQLQEIRTLGRGAVNDMAWSPDGATLAVASATGIWLYDINALDTPRHLSVANAVISSVAYSPDGRSLVSGGDDGVARVWDVGSGRELHSAQVDHMPISKVAFNADGKTIAFGEDDDSDVFGGGGTLWLWNLKTGDKTFVTDLGAMSALEFNPAGTLLAFGIFRDGHVLFFDMKTAQIRSAPDDSSAGFGVYALDFSKDGKKLAIVGGDDRAFVLDGETGNFLTEQNETSWGNAAAISPNGTLLAGGDASGAIKISSTVDYTDPGFYFSHGGSLHSLTEDEIQAPYIDGSYSGSPVSMLAFNPDGNLLASAAADGVIRLWDVKARIQKSVIDQHATFIQALKFSSDGKTLFGADDTIVTRSWDIQSGQQLSFTEGLQLVNGRGTWPHGESVAFSPASDIAVRGVSGGDIDFWNLQTGKTADTQLKFDDLDIVGLAFSPDGKRLASGGYGHVGVWDLSMGKERRSMEFSHLSGSLAFNAQGSVLAAGDDDGFIHLLNTQTGQQTGQISCSQGLVSALAFDSMGTWLASSTATETTFNICLINLKTNKVVAHLQGHTDTINGLSFSPNGKVLASVSSDQTLRLWNPATGMPIATYRGHLSPIQAIAFNPQGTFIATADGAGIIKLWGIPSEP